MPGQNSAEWPHLLGNPVGARRVSMARPSCSAAAHPTVPRLSFLAEKPVCAGGTLCAFRSGRLRFPGR
jgi:hypothetical protein